MVVFYVILLQDGINDNRLFPPVCAADCGDQQERLADIRNLSNQFAGAEWIRPKCFSLRSPILVACPFLQKDFVIVSVQGSIKE